MSVLHMPGIRPRRGVGDPLWDSVALLLHFDGAHGSTTFVDSSKYNHAMISGGAHRIDTTQFKFGGSSLWLEGVGGNDYVCLDSAGSELLLGTQDFTIEFFFRTSRSTTVFQIMYDSRVSAAGNGLAMVLEDDRFKLIRVIGGNSAVHDTGQTIALNTWYHACACRAGGTMRVFLNGVAYVSFADASNYSNHNTRRPLLGINPNNTQGYQGWIDEVRTTVGVGRYVANFTPPTKPYPG